MDPLWRRVALNPPRAYAPVLGSGLLRTEPEDFVVEEELGFAPAGAGQHVLLKVRKRNANTQWVARELARMGGHRPADIGYAGLKDRHAVTTQWFSVPRSDQALDAWSGARGTDFEVLEAHAHSRKLPRGALAGNRFEILLRDVSVDDDVLEARIAQIARRGVPNYFGPQRFGRDGANLERIGAGLHALRSPERGFVLSAARSLIFNALLAERVSDGSWERLEAGDLANLDGRGSIFPVEEVDPTLNERSERLEIHPTGPLWGGGSPASQGRPLEREMRIAAGFAAVVELTEAARMHQERRSLRLSVRDLGWSRRPAGIAIRFRLARGSFATTVLREILELSAVTEEQGDG